MAFPSLASAPCPPYFVDNIYDIFVAVAVNQSLTVAEYTTIASNCNIFPSSTTTTPVISFVTTAQSTATNSSSIDGSTSSTLSSTLTTEKSTVSTPPSIRTEPSTEINSSSSLSIETSTESTSSSTLTTEQSTVSTPPSSRTEPSTEINSSSSLSIEPSTESTSSSTLTTEQSTVSTPPSSRTEPSTEINSSSSLSIEPSTESTYSSTLSTERLTMETTSSPIITTENSTEATSSSTTSSLIPQLSTTTTASSSLPTEQPSVRTTSSSRRTEVSPATTSSTVKIETSAPTTSNPTVTTEQSTIPTSPTTTLTDTTNDATNTTTSSSSVTSQASSVISAGNACNDVCKITLGSTISIFLAFCILVFIFIRLQQNRKHRKDHYKKIHGFRKYYPANRFHQDQVMHGNFNRSSSWKSDIPAPFIFYKGHSRSLSDNSRSLVFDRGPLHFVNQIYLPDTTSTNIFETSRYQRKQNLGHSSSLETQQTYKPTLVQSKSLESYTLNRIDKPPRDSIYKRNCKPTRSSIKRKSYKESRSRGCTMGNPYSLEGYESESSYDSNGPALYDGPITFTPQFDRRPFPKVPSDLRREMIEQTRDSRRDNTGNQSRRRSRSHDPNLVSGYIERQFSFDLDPDCPGYRPAGRYKKHNPRQRKVSTASREFNMDNINRYSADVDSDNNNYMHYDGYGHNSEEYLNRGPNTNLRNRNTEQKVISSILKNGKPPNNRSRSDCSGEGLGEIPSVSDVFVANRNRSQSHGAATIGNTVKNQKPNTIYFYQTKL